MFIVYFILSGVVFGILYFKVSDWLKTKKWFLEFTDDFFVLFIKAFYAYRKEVINNKKLYDRYVDDFCIQNTRQVPDSLNKHGVVVSSNKKNLIKNRVQKLLETRPDLVQKYFQSNDFTYEDYKRMIVEYDITVPVQILEECSPKETVILTNRFEDVKEVVKDEILKYQNGIKDPIHIGHRIFGYLIQEGYIPACKNNEQRLKEWEKFTGSKFIPEFDYLRRPGGNKSSSKNINQNLEIIDDFFHSIKLKVRITYFEKK